MQEPDFLKGGGLIPAIIQNASNGKVLMLGYMNKEAYEKTMSEGIVCFFSRSKQRLWVKGETSGNYLHVVSMQSDCDNDTLLIQAKPLGPVCHTGDETCFGNSLPAQGINFLLELQQVIQQRASSDDQASYTRKLLLSGIDRIAQKVGEEAVETVIAAKNNDERLLKGEIADLIFHLMVLMHQKNISLESIASLLESRHQK